MIKSIKPAGLLVAALGACLLARTQAQDSPTQKTTQNESVTAAEQARSRQAAGAPEAAAGAASRDALAAQMPVARLSHLAGTVSVSAESGTAPPVDAALNMPLVAGSRLLAGDNGEAEVEFADGSVLRLTPGSAASLSRLDPSSQSTQLNLGNGLFYLELRASERGAYTVQAADLLVSPEENASFRVRVQDAQVETAVLAGSVSVTRANAYTTQVSAGESVRTDPKNGRRYLLADTVSPEAWDSWNERLAQAAQDEQASRTTARDGYAGEQGYGWADLDAQGQWYSVPGEGDVWQPAVADAGFDPYGAGSWVYGPGGYTWASGYSWGWLPYRCGAWSFYNGFGWGWVPSTGCLSFGFGGGYGGGYDGGYDGGGGYRVRHPPAGWHPPHRPVAQGPGGILRHPTVPVRYRPTDASPVHLPPRSATAPVRIDGAVATTLPRVGRAVTPQGGSAVGSSLLRDFPVREGTHDPVLGVLSQTPVAVPGRQADWHRVGSPAAAGAARGTPGASGWTAGRGAGVPAAPGAGMGAETGYIGGSAPTYGLRRLPLPTDPPVGANGAVPLGASGAPPLGASGAPPVGANGAPPVGATGTPTVVPGVGITQGELILRRGGVTPSGVMRAPGTPMAPHGGMPPVQSGIAVPRPASSAPLQPVYVPRMSAPAPIAVPRMSVPSAAPAAPRVAPAPAAPAAPSAKPK